jgi:hypothetical protein
LEIGLRFPDIRAGGLLLGRDVQNIAWLGVEGGGEQGADRDGGTEDGEEVGTHGGLLFTEACGDSKGSLPSFDIFAMTAP